MIPDTKELRIETSTVCSFNCTFCPRDSFIRKKSVMSTDHFKRILTKVKNEIPKIEFISITGYGESFLDPDWRSKVSFARKLFSKIHMITNLSPLDIDDCDFLADHVTDIRISAYAMTEEVYQKIHRPPAKITLHSEQAKILHLINRKPAGSQIILNYIETDDNAFETADWIEYWKERADLIEVWRPHNWIDGRAYRTICMHREKQCYRPFSGPVQVLVDGRVNLCCFDYNGELVIGDALYQSFEEIYTGEVITRIRELHTSGNADEIEQCKLCDQRNCTDCRAEKAIYNSRFNPRDRVNLRANDFQKDKP